MDNTDQPKPATDDIEARITEYLAAGGLFNPELMEHEKVRDLLMDCRAALAALAIKAKFYDDAFTEGDKTTIQQLSDQLAAEREKVQELEEELYEAVKLLKLEDIDAEIAKVETRLGKK